MVETRAAAGGMLESKTTKHGACQRHVAAAETGGS
jgi:hypothetical protein